MQCSVSQSSPRSSHAGSSGKQQTLGWMDMVSWRRTAGYHPPTLGVTPKPLTRRRALPSIKTCLWFILCHFPPPPQRKGGSIASDILPTEGGGGGSLFEHGISAVLWRQSQPRELHVPRAWASTLNLPGRRKKKKNKPKANPSCKHRWMARQWQSHCHSAPELSLLSLLPCCFCSVSTKIFQEKLWKQSSEPHSFSQKIIHKLFLKKVIY